jgi:hypothetical protein
VEVEGKRRKRKGDGEKDLNRGGEKARKKR